MTRRRVFPINVGSPEAMAGIIGPTVGVFDGTKGLKNTLAKLASVERPPAGSFQSGNQGDSDAAKPTGSVGKPKSDD